MWWHRGNHLSDQIGCQCALSENCENVGIPTVCNCDARIFNQTDIGILSSDKLPVYALRYGGAYTDYSSIRTIIEPLICTGKKGYYPSEAENIEKRDMKLKLSNFMNQLQDTREDLDDLSNKLENYLRTTKPPTTAPPTTITTTTAVFIPVFEKKESFSARQNHKIGEINTFHQNFRFSMELKYSTLSTSYRGVFVGNVRKQCKNNCYHIN